MTFCIQEKKRKLCELISSSPATAGPAEPGAWGQAGVPREGPRWPCAVPVTPGGCSRALADAGG